MLPLAFGYLKSGTEQRGRVERSRKVSNMQDIYTFLTTQHWYKIVSMNKIL